MPVVLALPYIGLFSIFRIKGAFTEAHGAMVMSSKCRMHIWQMNVILSFNAFSIYLSIHQIYRHQHWQHWPDRSGHGFLRRIQFHDTAVRVQKETQDTKKAAWTTNNKGNSAKVINGVGNACDLDSILCCSNHPIRLCSI